MAAKLRFIEYIGNKERKEYYGVNCVEYVFEAVDDWHGRKITAVDNGTAEECLRFPNVFREVQLRELEGLGKVGNRNQGDLLEREGEAKEPEVDSTEDSIKEAMQKDREAIQKKVSRKRKR